MKYHAAIFDLDGTLIDSIRDIGEAMNRTLTAAGYPAHPMDSYLYFVGDGVRLLIERALPPEQQNEETVSRILAQYRQDYADNWKTHTRPYDGIPQLMNELHAHGIPMGVLSNKPDGMTRKCVAHFFPEIPFSAVAGQKEDTPRKPDPSAALLIAGVMNVPPAQCVFIGDTATDMQTAVAAGMFPAGVSWGFRNERELISSGARLIAVKPEALLGLFVRLPE